MKKDFLFEIGTEELPAKQLELLKNSLQQQVQQLLEKLQLSYSGEIRAFATPRRLAIFIAQLQTLQADQVIERKGPALQNAFDAEGKPTKACEGFAKSCQMQVSDLERRDTPQGQWLFAQQKIQGKPAVELLPQLMQEALDKLPIAKPMHWGAHAKSFLRPVRWVLMMLGEEVVPATFFELATNNLTYGHRFMTSGAIKITDSQQYEKILAERKVIADFATRKAMIQQQLTDAATQMKGQLCDNEDLLIEVTGLVEWPCVLTTNFAARFLQVPDNALIASMESHQKSFAVRDQQGKLLPHALIVSNLISKDPKQVIIGNERVLCARLSDAEFFYQKDLQIPLENYVDDLKKVVFQTQLGSLYAKTQALATFAANIAEQLGFSKQVTHQAGLLAKCDLRTQMVSEFPELQGEMGKIYGLKQGLSQEAASALYEQYLPRFAQDALPETGAGIALAIADRLLNLVGIFGVGQIPTGEKDPFALRRAAIGVCRIISDKRLNLPLLPLIIQAQAAWQAQNTNLTTSNLVDQVYDFILERFRNIYLEQGIRPQVIQAVFNLRLDDLLDIHERIHAINIFQNLPEAASLAAAQKRVMNLFQKEKLSLTDLEESKADLFETEQEQALANRLIELKAQVGVDLSAKKYTKVLQKMAALKTPVDDFFDHVMVMVDDAKLRHNRLCLLAQLSGFLNQVADISQL